jgi:hypothetical protein
MISLIHPSRSRPEQAAKAAHNWLSKAKTPIEYILSLDIDDISIYDHAGRSITNSNRSAVDAINAGAKACEGDIIVVMSDDFDCPDWWDLDLLKAVEGKTDWIAKTNDDIQRWIITLPIMDRTYYNRFGYIYHPDYLHMFCDTELTAVADMTGRKINVPMEFTHNHYSTGRFKKDAISERADKTWNQGEALFLQRYKTNFGLSGKLNPITSQDYLNWIKSKI